MKGERKARQGIVSRLRAGQTVGEWEDLSAYPDGGYFVVGLLPEGQLDMRGLTQEQARQLAEEGEVSAYLDTPEEAADLYLKWNEDYGGALARAPETRPRSAQATAIPEEAGGTLPGSGGRAVFGTSTGATSGGKSLKPRSRSWPSSASR